MIRGASGAIVTAVMLAACGTDSTTPASDGGASSSSGATSSSGGSSGASSSGDASGGSAECTSACAKVASCGDRCEGICDSVCARPEVVSGFIACVNDPATVCNASIGEGCYSKAAKAAPVRAADTDYTNACVARRSECGSSSFNDDYCASGFLADACVATVSDCLKKPCAEIGACLRAVFKP